MDANVIFPLNGGLNIMHISVVSDYNLLKDLQ